MWDKIFSFCVPFPLAGLENCNPLCMTDLKFWIDCNFILWIPSSVNFRLSTELTSSQGSRLNIQTPDYVSEGINLDHSNSFSVIKITKQFKLSTLYLDSLNFHNGNKLNLFNQSIDIFSRRQDSLIKICQNFLWSFFCRSVCKLFLI